MSIAEPTAEDEPGPRTEPLPSSDGQPPPDAIESIELAGAGSPIDGPLESESEASDDAGTSLVDQLVRRQIEVLTELDDLDARVQSLLARCQQRPAA